MKDNNRMNGYLRFGLLMFAIFLILNQFCPGIEFLKGLLFGLGLFFELYGIYVKNHPDNALRRWKLNLLHKVK